MLYCCHFQSHTPRPLWIQYLPHQPRTGRKRFVLRGSCGRTGAARLKRTTCRQKELEEIIRASTVSGGKEKQMIHWGLKENSFLDCWDPQHQLRWTESHQHRAPKDCGREEGDDNSTILLKDSCKYAGWAFKLGWLICELKLPQVHSFGQGFLQCLVRKCRWNWFHIKSLLLGGNPRLPYRS